MSGVREMLSARNMTTIFAVAFIGSGLIGFVPNPLVAPDGIFAVNVWHNLVHVVTGCFFGFGALSGEIASVRVIRTVALFYIMVTVLGFMSTGDMLLGFIHVNQADRWLHLSLAVVITFAGFGVLRGAKSSAVSGS
jgi:hypothetical protein